MASAKCYGRHSVGVVVPAGALFVSDSVSAAAALRIQAQRDLIAGFEEIPSSDSSAASSDEEERAPSTSLSSPRAGAVSSSARILRLFTSLVGHSAATQIEEHLRKKHGGVNSAYTLHSRDLISSLRVLESASSSLLADIRSMVVRPFDLVNMSAGSLAPAELRALRAAEAEKLLKTTIVRQIQEKEDEHTRAKKLDKKRDEAASAHLEAAIQIQTNLAPAHSISLTSPHAHSPGESSEADRIIQRFSEATKAAAKAKANKSSKLGKVTARRGATPNRISSAGVKLTQRLSSHLTVDGESSESESEAVSTPPVATSNLPNSRTAHPNARSHPIDLISPTSPVASPSLKVNRLSEPTAIRPIAATELRPAISPAETLKRKAMGIGIEMDKKPTSTKPAKPGVTFAPSTKSATMPRPKSPPTKRPKVDFTQTDGITTAVIKSPRPAPTPTNVAASALAAAGTPSARPNSPSLPSQADSIDPIRLPERTALPSISSFNGRLSFAAPRRGELALSFFALPANCLFASHGPLSSTMPVNRFDSDAWKHILPVELNQPHKMKLAKIETYIRHKSASHLATPSAERSASLQAAARLYPVTFTVESTDPLLSQLFKDTSDFYRSHELALACDYESSRFPSTRQCNVWLMPPGSLHLVTHTTATEILKWTNTPKCDEWWGIMWIRAHVWKTMRQAVEAARRKAESELDVPSDEEGAHQITRPMRTDTHTVHESTHPATEPAPVDSHSVLRMIQDSSGLGASEYLTSLLNKLTPTPIPPPAPASSSSPRGTPPSLLAQTIDSYLASQTHTHGQSDNANDNGAHTSDMQTTHTNNSNPQPYATPPVDWHSSQPVVAGASHSHVQPLFYPSVSPSWPAPIASASFPSHESPAAPMATVPHSSWTTTTPVPAIYRADQPWG